MADGADCEMCDGSGEIDVPKLDEYGNVPCPDCVSREMNERLDTVTGQLARLIGALHLDGMLTEAQLAKIMDCDIVDVRKMRDAGIARIQDKAIAATFAAKINEAAQRN